MSILFSRCKLLLRKSEKKTKKVQPYGLQAQPNAQKRTFQRFPAESSAALAATLRGMAMTKTRYGAVPPPTFPTTMRIRKKERTTFSPKNWSSQPDQISHFTTTDRRRIKELNQTFFPFFQGPKSPTFTRYQPHHTFKMSVVGVDFGTLNTVIAVARNRGVDVVCQPAPPTDSLPSSTKNNHGRYNTGRGCS